MKDIRATTHATPFTSNNYASAIGEDLRCVSSGHNIRAVFRMSLEISYVYRIYDRDSVKASGVVYGIHISLIAVGRCIHRRDQEGTGDIRRGVTEK